MKKRIMKIATLMTAAVALVLVTVLVTVAYLTSFSTVSNTFTVGKVGIHMYESSVDENGQKLPDTNKNGSMKDSAQNTYTLIPGKTYDKDPTIYVDAGSAGAYLFVVLHNDIKDIEIHLGEEINAKQQKSIASQMEDNGWAKLGTVDSAKGEVYFYAKEGNALKTDAVEVTAGEYLVFSTFTICTDADVSPYTDKKVELTAYAIQADTFDATETKSAAEYAWAAIVETYPEAGPAPAAQ